MEKTSADKIAFAKEQVSQIERNYADKVHALAKERASQIERKIFTNKILTILIGYVGITFWLNAIRANSALWFVWVLIIIQFLLYFSIFNVSYQRSKECGLKSLGIPLFLILAILGRVGNWEIVIIPLVVIVMLVVSTKNKN